MNLNIDSHIDLYITLCSQLCKKAEDYTKERVKKHNIAMRRLNELRENMKSNPMLAERVYDTLLNCSDVYIQQSAATDCLLLNIHIKPSVKVLEKVSKCGDRMRAMEAKRTLLVWKGKINSNDPF